MLDHGIKGARKERVGDILNLRNEGEMIVGILTVIVRPAGGGGGRGALYCGGETPSNNLPTHPLYIYSFLFLLALSINIFGPVPIKDMQQKDMPPAKKKIKHNLNWEKVIYSIFTDILVDI